MDIVERLRNMHNNEELNSGQFWANILEAANEIERLRRVEDVVFKYIDRMTDVCPEDPADKILSEFLSDIQPLCLAALDNG